MVAESRFRDFCFFPSSTFFFRRRLNTMAPAPFAFGVEQKLNSFAF